MIIVEDLYNKALIEPCREGANELRIISGYASSAMAFHHLEDLKAFGLNIHISLLLGMCSADGISISNHLGFQNIMNVQYPKNFICGYIHKIPPVHSKAYIWHKNGAYYKSFIGSANYTQNAFSKNQRELLYEMNNAEIQNYFALLESDSIYCNNQEAQDFVRIYNDKRYFKNQMRAKTIDKNINSIPPQSAALETITVSLLSARTDDVQKIGGLNWGQRKGREPNQAYIQLPPEAYKTDFFPKKPKHFTVVTDDSKSFICVRAQKDDSGQAIETPHNNSLLGEYFRNRLGVPNGAFVRKEDIKRYGRTDIVFYKFDDENYYMDFSSPQK
jgi:hypothetical protein